MAFSYFVTQPPNAWWPVTNAGALAAMGFFVFVAFAAIGPGLFSVDAIVDIRRTRRERTTLTLSPWIKTQYRRRALR